MAKHKPKFKLSVKSFSHLTPFWALIIANIIWGGTYSISKVTLHEFPVMTLAFLRFALASLLLAPFLVTERTKIKIKLQDLPALIGASLGLVTLNIAFFYEGIKRTSTLDASILVLIIPCLSVLIGWRMLKEKIYFINLIGLILSFLGSIIVIGLPLLITGNLTSEVLVGNILIILSGISFVVGALLAKKLLKTYPVLVITATSFIVSTLVFAVPAVNEYLVDPTWISQISLLGVFGLFYIVIFSSIVAYFAYSGAIQKISLSHANLFHYIETVTAAVIAVLFLSERISFSLIIGTCLIILGVYWGTISKIEHHHHHFKGHRI